MSFNDNHPELRDGEMFYSNMTIHHYTALNYKSKRFGVKCYTQDGKDYVLELRPVVPVFIKASDYLGELG